MTLPTLPERIARLVEDLRAAAVDIEFSSPQCPVRRSVAAELQALAEDMEDFALAIDIEDQESPRH